MEVSKTKSKYKQIPVSRYLYCFLVVIGPFDLSANKHQQHLFKTHVYLINSVLFWVGV